MSGLLQKYASHFSVQATVPRRILQTVHHTVTVRQDGSFFGEAVSKTAGPELALLVVS